MNTPYGSFNYTYDDGSRLRVINNHKSESFAINYDSANRIKEITRPGSYSSFIYDATSFLSSMIHYNNSNAQINGFNYGRDGIGNRTSKLSAYGTNSYSYDEKSQLKSATNPEADSDYLNEVFTYDELGNRIGDQNGNYTYGAKGQRLMEDYKFIYAYDNNGNLTSKQERGFTGNVINYTYSSENQLIKVEEFESGNLIKRSEYAYDALGRRMKKEVEDFNNSTNSFERKYVYDGDEILAEYGSSNSILAVYTQSTLRTDDVLAVDVTSSGVSENLATQSGSYQYLKDALGSITDVVNNAGALIQHYAYSSFGKILKIRDNSGADITSNPILKTAYSFTGREYDAETGMHYYRARYYMPEIGRFIQEDPDPGRLISPNTHTNKYIYTANNPVNYVDPDGEAFFIPLLIVMAKSALIGGAINAAVSGVITGDWSLNSLGSAFTSGAVSGAIFGGLGFGIGYGLAKWTSFSDQAIKLITGGVLGTIGGIRAYNSGPSNLPADKRLFAGFLGFIGGFWSGYLGASSGIKQARFTAPKTPPVPTNNAPKFKDTVNCTYSTTGQPVRDYESFILEGGKCR